MWSVKNRQSLWRSGRVGGRMFNANDEKVNDAYQGWKIQKLKRPGYHGNALPARSIGWNGQCGCDAVPYDCASIVYSMEQLPAFRNRVGQANLEVFSQSFGSSPLRWPGQHLLGLQPIVARGSYMCRSRALGSFWLPFMHDGECSNPQQAQPWQDALRC